MNLHVISQVDQQGVRPRWDVIPDAISENLQPTDVVVDHKNSDNGCIGVGLDAKDEIRSRAPRVVDESSVSGSPVAELSDEVVLVEPQELRHCRKESVLHSVALYGVLMQNIPAEKFRFP